MTVPAAGVEVRPAKRTRALGRADSLAAVSLAAAVGLLYGSILRLWWTVDDLFILRLLSIHPALDYVVSAHAWSLAPKMFTPLQFVSYGLDLALFGRRPVGFHAHHLAALAAAALAFYAALRQWLKPLMAWTGSMLLLLGIPTASWVVELPCRHYIEGLLWAALAVLGFARATRGGGRSVAALSVFFYFLAILEKEIYIPLALLVLLPEGSVGARVRRIGPYLLALLAYLGWRWAMLGTLLGGYGWTVRAREIPGLVLRLPVRVVATLLSKNALADVLLAACLAAGVGVLIARRPRLAMLLAGCAVLALLPILPVAKAVGERFGALLWIVLVLAFLLGCRELATTSPPAAVTAVVLILVGLVAASWVHRVDWQSRLGVAQEMSAEGRFFLSMKPGDLLRRPRIPPAAMQETRWLKEEYLKLPAGAGWFTDDVYLCGPGGPPGRIWQYDVTSKQVHDVTGQARSAAARYCAGLRRAPLQASFQSSGGNLFWTLGPYEKGEYALVTDHGVTCVPVARDDGYQTAPGLLSLQVRYQAPEGWVTYSPELTMDFRAASRFHWERPRAMP